MYNENKSNYFPLVLAISVTLGLFGVFFALLWLSGPILIFFIPVGSLVIDFSVLVGYHDMNILSENNLHTSWD